MTENTNEQAQGSSQPVPSDVEINLAKQRKMYERQLEQERVARIQLEQRLSEMEKSKQQVFHDEDDDDSEPYVDRRRLAKTTNKVKQEIRQETQQETQKAINDAIERDRIERYLESNPDFKDTLDTHADKLAHLSPSLAKSILAMPDNFERQKIVYESIKLLGLNKPKQAESSIQQKVEQNRRSPFQPFGVGSPAYGISNGGYTPSAQEGKNLYDQMKDRISKMRIN